jgi:endonuclease YncB( thermonuclease family)
MEVTTRVRLRGIDAPELHARCDDERAKALAARDALARILAEAWWACRASARINMAAASMPMSRQRTRLMRRP